MYCVLVICYSAQGADGNTDNDMCYIDYIMLGKKQKMRMVSMNCVHCIMMIFSNAMAAPPLMLIV